MKTKWKWGKAKGGFESSSHSDHESLKLPRLCEFNLINMSRVDVCRPFQPHRGKKFASNELPSFRIINAVVTSNALLIENCLPPLVPLHVIDLISVRQIWYIFHGHSKIIKKTYLVRFSGGKVFLCYTLPWINSGSGDVCAILTFRMEAD